MHVKVTKEEQQEFEQVLKDADLFKYFALQNTVNDAYVRYIGDWLKWYDGYRDVRKVDDWITSAHKYPRGIVAIGEDDYVTHIGDTEELDMYTNVSIQW